MYTHMCIYIYIYICTHTYTWATLAYMFILSKCRSIGDKFNI